MLLDGGEHEWDVCREPIPVDPGVDHVEEYPSRHWITVNDAVIRLENVNKQFARGSNAVRNLTLDIRGGETCVLIGPSGCGKTTTLRMINRLSDPDSGRILIDGEDTSGVDPRSSAEDGLRHQARALPAHDVRRQRRHRAAPVGLGSRYASRRAWTSSGAGRPRPKEYRDRYPPALGRPAAAASVSPAPLEPIRRSSVG